MTWNCTDLMWGRVKENIPELVGDSWRKAVLEAAMEEADVEELARSAVAFPSFIVLPRETRRPRSRALRRDRFATSRGATTTSSLLVPASSITCPAEMTRRCEAGGCLQEDIFRIFPSRTRSVFSPRMSRHFFAGYFPRASEHACFESSGCSRRISRWILWKLPRLAPPIVRVCVCCAHVCVCVCLRVRVCVYIFFIYIYFWW